MLKAQGMMLMNEKKTSALDNILKSATLKDFEKIAKNEILEGVPSLSNYLENYLAAHSLDKSTVIKDSLLSRDYAYAIFNGNRANPTRDRVLALCLAMHMTLDDVQRTLKLANVGALYSKNPRDAVIIIAFNTGKYDVGELNDFLHAHEQEIIKTFDEKR